MRLEISIDMDSDAIFSGGPRELKRILATVVATIGNYPLGWAIPQGPETLTDVNGNAVGTAELIED